MKLIPGKLYMYRRETSSFLHRGHMFRFVLEKEKSTVFGRAIDISTKDIFLCTGEGVWDKNYTGFEHDEPYWIFLGPRGRLLWV